MAGLFDPCDPPPTDRSSSGPPATSGDRRLAGSGALRPLAVLDRSFRLLVCEPAPLALDGFAVDGLPHRPIPLDVLRGMLLHPSVGFDTRDTALTWLVGRAQAEGGAWLVGLAGVLSRADAELIAATRLQEIPLRQLAGRWDAGYEALRKRRYRAEAALARWLAAERDVPTDPAAGGLVG